MHNHMPLWSQVVLSCLPSCWSHTLHEITQPLNVIALRAEMNEAWKKAWICRSDSFENSDFSKGCDFSDEVFSRILFGVSETVELTEIIGLRIGSSGFSFCSCFYVILTSQLKTLKKTLTVPFCDLEDISNHIF